MDHAGVETTLVIFQTKFWVPGARTVIKSVKSKFAICRKLEQCMGQVISE